MLQSVQWQQIQDWAGTKSSSRWLVDTNQLDLVLIGSKPVFLAYACFGCKPQSDDPCIPAGFSWSDI
jgi:hypothetical protein